MSDTVERLERLRQLQDMRRQAEQGIAELLKGGDAELERSGETVIWQIAVNQETQIDLTMPEWTARGDLVMRSVFGLNGPVIVKPGQIIKLVRVSPETR